MSTRVTSAPSAPAAPVMTVEPVFLLARGMIDMESPYESIGAPASRCKPNESSVDGDAEGETECEHGRVRKRRNLEYVSGRVRELQLTTTRALRLADHIAGLVAPLFLVQVHTEPDASLEAEGSPTTDRTEHTHEHALCVAHRIDVGAGRANGLVRVTVIEEHRAEHVALHRMAAQPKSDVERRAAQGAEPVRFLTKRIAESRKVAQRRR